MPRANSVDSDWTTFGRDMLVSVSGEPRGRWESALCEQVRSAVRSGALRPGTRLPSTRGLAHDLGMSRGVVVSAYEQLEAEGYLYAHHGSGTVVADVTMPGSPSQAPARDPVRSPIRHSPGLPDPNLFPRQTWLRAYRRSLRALPDRDLAYGHPQGYEPLRAELADYLGRVRGLRATPDDILIINGLAQGFALLARILADSGARSIAVEEPGSTGARDQLQKWGVDTPPVAVDKYGLVVDALERTAAEAVLVTPAHHYPTGVVLAPTRRLALLEWARRKPGRYVIEDDYDAEYRYDSNPVGSLQPLDPERVITGSSISKTLAPGLRLGWLVLPPELMENAVSLKAAFDLGTPVLNQATFAELLRSGDFDRHLRHSRTHYRRLRHRAAARLTRDAPDVSLSGLEAGLTLCIHFDAGDDKPIAAQLQDAGVDCQPLSFYQQAGRPLPGLVIDLPSLDNRGLDLVAAAVAGRRFDSSADRD